MVLVATCFTASLDPFIMSSPADSNNSSPENPITSDPPSNPNAPRSVVVLNVQHSLKLTSTNYSAWKVQMSALFIGYDLVGFIDGTNTCPATNHADYAYWRRQDQLILHAIITSVDHKIITMLGNVKTSKQA